MIAARAPLKTATVAPRGHRLLWVAFGSWGHYLQNIEAEGKSRE